MKVFSKKKFLESDLNCGLYCRIEEVREWVDESDGKPVVDRHCNGMNVWPAWEDDVYNPVEETGKILNACFPNGFPDDPTALNCRCTILKEAPPKHPRYKVVIECNDDFTTAKMYVDGQQVKGECAKRHPEDKFNWRIGAQTAFNRLWLKKEKPVKAQKKWLDITLEKAAKEAQKAMEDVVRKLP